MKIIIILILFSSYMNVETKYVCKSLKCYWISEYTVSSFQVAENICKNLKTKNINETRVVEATNKNEVDELAALMSDYTLGYVVLNAVREVGPDWFWMDSNRKSSFLSSSNSSNAYNYVFVDHLMKPLASKFSTLRGFACHYRKHQGACENLPKNWIETETFWLDSIPDGNCVVFVSSPLVDFMDAITQCSRINSSLLEFGEENFSDIKIREKRWKEIKSGFNDTGMLIEKTQRFLRKNKQESFLKADVLERQLQLWWHQKYFKKESSFWIGLSMYRWVWKDSKTLITLSSWSNGHPIPYSEESSCLFSTTHQNETFFVSRGCEDFKLNLVCEIQTITEVYQTTPLYSTTYVTLDTLENQESFPVLLVTLTASLLSIVLTCSTILICYLCIHKKHCFRRHKEEAENNDGYILTSSSFYTSLNYNPNPRVVFNNSVNNYENIDKFISKHGNNKTFQDDTIDSKAFSGNISTNHPTTSRENADSLDKNRNISIISSSFSQANDNPDELYSVITRGVLS